MLVTIGQKPLADFTQPIEMLKNCHRRIEYFLDLLGKVERQFGESELSDEGRRALTSAVNYFAEFAPRHTADEEASLFPRLRESHSPEARAVLAEVQRLERNHRTCETAHATVDWLVRQWIASGRINVAPRTVLRSTLAELAKRCNSGGRLRKAPGLWPPVDPGAQLFCQASQSAPRATAISARPRPTPSS